MNKLITLLQKYPERLVIIAIVLNILVHAPFLNLPPCSIHVWRQCNTLAVARNFFEEGGSIFQPRVDRRYDGNGITGMQFPAYEWLLSKIYFITGVQNWVHRTFSLFIFSTGIWMMYCFFIQLTEKKWLAACIAWSFCWSPELFYHGINALPDILAITAGIASLCFFCRWMQVRKVQLFVWSMFFIMVAGLIKMQYLMAGAFMCGTLLVSFKNNTVYSKKEIALLFISAIIVLFTVFSWYDYATALIKKSNLYDFGITVRPEKNAQVAINTLKKNLISDFPELLLNYANTILLLIGVSVFFYKHKWKNRNFIPFFLVALCYLVFHLLELHQMVVHHYYMLPSLLPLFAAIGIGIGWLMEKKAYGVLFLLLIAQPVLAGIRILPARWMKNDKGILVEFADTSKLIHLQNAVPDTARVFMGPDESGCIFFYFLHKKGFGYYFINDLTTLQPNGKTMLEDGINRGAAYLYLKGEHPGELEKIKPFIGEKMMQEGAFSVYKLHPKNNISNN